MATVDADLKYLDAEEADLSLRQHKDLLDLITKDAYKDVKMMLQSLSDKQCGPEEKGKGVTESTYFIKSVKRNLLHIASYRCATECCRLLVNAPYDWNPDLRDDKNRTPMQFAEEREDIPTLYELARFSGEVRNIDRSIPRPELGGLCATCLVWPQDLSIRPLRREALIQFRSIGIKGWPNDITGQHMCDDILPGQLTGLIFEMYMATPSLFAFDLNTGESLGITDQSFWPILPVEDAVWAQMNHASCKDYPHCMLHSVRKNVKENKRPKECLLALRNLWLLHRFGQVGVDGRVVLTPPSLMRLCRNEIRRAVVQHAIEQVIAPNYMQLINKLGLTRELKDFLMYRDLWAKRDLDDYYKDIFQSNVPYGPALTMVPGELDKYGAGVYINHRFLPTKVTRPGTVKAC